LDLIWQRLLRVDGVLPTLKRESDLAALPVNTLCELSVELFKIRRIAEAKEAEGGRDRALRRLMRRLDRQQELLTEAGVVLQDHTGEKFNPGVNLDVAYSEKRPGLERAEIVETLEPSVFFNDRLVRPGRVGVEIPAEEERSDGKS
jgi:hypothetical protein